MCDILFYSKPQHTYSYYITDNATKYVFPIFILVFNIITLIVPLLT